MSDHTPPPLDLAGLAALDVETRQRLAALETALDAFLRKLREFGESLDRTEVTAAATRHLYTDTQEDPANV